MTDSDELLAKADTLLARWRSGAVVPLQQGDYPVLTEVVKGPATHGGVTPPKIPSEPEMPKLDAFGTGTGAASGDPLEVPVLDSPDDPILSAPAAPAAADTMLATLDAAAELPDLPSIDAMPAPVDAAMQALEERVRLRVLESIEPYVGAFIEEPLRRRIEELTQDLAAVITREARDDILTLVRDAVRSAVARELDARRDERSV